jgi:poly(3-hydroxybutyrate) depolymerase
MLTLAKSNLCIDVTRVFGVGWSFGAFMTYALSLNHQKQLRAVVAMSSYNTNFSFPTNLHEHIAYLGVTGMSDSTTPFQSLSTPSLGGKYCALTHATDNACALPTDIPVAVVGSKTHLCYDFEGCAAGYPVKMCTFDGVHQSAPSDGGTGENYASTWVPAESWNFIAQF